MKCKLEKFTLVFDQFFRYTKAHRTEMVTVQRPESPIILICLSPNCSEISGNRTGDKLMIFDTEGHSVR